MMERGTVMRSRRDRSIQLTSIATLALTGALLAGAPAEAATGCGKFPATGQTTCWDSSGNVIPCAGTGQDGDFQAGKTLSYIDNGNGTITDMVTGLMWEKKSHDGSIHDMDNRYVWDDAFAVFVAGLNAAKFAGHKDWRLPNAKELQSIIDYEEYVPSVHSAFNTGCVPSCTVLTCSCTTADNYWSSTSHAGFPGEVAWAANVFDGFIQPATKSLAFLFVRAVRDGCK
jgi:hypothetical protein